MHPLDLPEIMSIIAQFLTQHDLAVCARVSHTWNQACLPLLWQQLTLVMGKLHYYHNVTDIESDSVLHHSHLIKKLDIRNNFYGYSSFLFTAVSGYYCQNLETLALFSPDVFQAHYIQRHRLTLVHLHLVLYFESDGDSRSQKSSDDLWQTIASCPSLKTLAISEVYVTHSSWPACWSLWSRLTSLRLCNVDFSPLRAARNGQDTADHNNSPWHQRKLCSLSELLAQEDLCQPPMRIKTLDVSHSQNIANLEDELALLKHCPDLESLVWFVSFSRFSGDQFGQLLATEVRHCPKLVNITLGLGVTNRNALAPILKATGNLALPLQRLGLRTCFLSKEALEFIRTVHGSSLRTLELQGTTIFDGSLVQDLLCSLTGLEKLTAHSMKHSHLVKDPRPWVCLGLKHLQLGINLAEGNGPTIQKIVTQRLGTLINLRYLELYSRMGRNHCVRFRLDDGLEDLGGLRALRELSLDRISQELDLKDVSWMMEHWPRLQYITGELNSDKETDAMLKGVLNKKGVVTVLPKEKILHIIETEIATTNSFQPPHAN